MAASTITVPDGTVLHVEIEGPADAPVTVVLVHGWTLDSRTWGPVAQALTGGLAPARVVRPDHRGHGRSGAADPATMTIDRLADNLAAVIEEVAPEGPLVLAGHSMGGMTLMALAQQHPGVIERVGGVALVATASGGLRERPFGLPPRGATVLKQVETRLSGAAWWARRKRFGNRYVLTPSTRWLLLGRRPGPTALRITCESVAQCRPLTVTGFLETLRDHDRDDALAAFAGIPTVVMVGSRDRLTPVPISRRIVAALPSADLAIFPDAGHMLPLERAGAVAERIAALVDRAPAVVS